MASGGGFLSLAIDIRKSCKVASIVSCSKSGGLLERPCGQHPRRGAFSASLSKGIHWMPFFTSMVSHSKSGGLLEKAKPINRGGVLSPLRYRRASTGCPSSHPWSLTPKVGDFWRRQSLSTASVDFSATLSKDIHWMSFFTFFSLRFGFFITILKKIFAGLGFFCIFVN